MNRLALGLLVVAGIVGVILISRPPAPDSATETERRERGEDRTEGGVAPEGEATTDPSGMAEPIDPADIPGGAIVGVIRGKDGQPVVGAMARALRTEKDWEKDVIAGRLELDLVRDAFTSAVDGSYRVEGLAAGRHLLVVRAGGFRDGIARGIVIRKDETTTADVTLEPGRKIRGRVVDADENPVAATVRAEEPDGRLARFLDLEEERGVRTGDDGAFELTGLGANPVTLVVEPVAWDTITVNDVEPGTQDLLVRLEESATVTGRVLDAETDREVAGAYAVVGTTGQKTDEGGQFRLEGLPPGRRQLAAGREGYAATYLELELAPGEVVEHLVVRIHRGTVLRGTVVRASDGGPVPDSRVTLPLGMEAKTSGAGEFAIGPLTPGRHTILVKAEGFAPRRQTVELPVAEPIHIALTEGGSIRGTVRDDDGNALPNAWLWLTEPTNTQSGEPASTDAGGRFRYDHVPPGPQIVIHVRVGGGTDYEMKQVTVVDGRETVIDFGGEEKTVRATLSGRLLNRGKPAGMRAVVLVPIRGGGRSFKFAVSDLSGRYRVPGLEPGTYRVMTSDLGRQNVEVVADVQVTEGGEIQQDLALPEGRLTGAVFRADGKTPIARARIVIVHPDRIREAGRTVADIMEMFQGQTYSRTDGTFEFPNAPPAGHTLLVSADGFAPASVDGIVVEIQGPDDEPVAPIEVKLNEGIALTAEVKGAEGEALAGVAIFLRDATGRYVLTGESEPRTGPDGRVVIRVEPGTYRLLVQGEGHAPAERDVEVRSDRLLTTTLERGGDVGVTLIDARGPVPAADVRVFREDGTEVFRRLTQEGIYSPPTPSLTGLDGRYVVTHLPTGRLRVLARAPGGRSAEAWIEVTTGERTEVSIRLE